MNQLLIDTTTDEHR